MMVPSMERDGDEMMVMRKQKNPGHRAAQTNIVFNEGGVEGVEGASSPAAFHLSRKAGVPAPSAPCVDAEHATAIAKGELSPFQAQGRWQTTAMIANQGHHDDVGTVKAWKPGKRCVQPTYARGGDTVAERIVQGNVEDRSTGAMNDPALSEKLAEGTWKPAGHVPGYTGHVPAANEVPVQPAEGRSLDKAAALFGDNYKQVYDGYKGVSKLVPEM